MYRHSSPWPTRLRWHLLFLALLALLAAVVAPRLVRAASGEPLALGLYVPWFDSNTWNANVTSDLPTPLYNADDPAAIQRDVSLAQKAGLNGFVSFWIAPGNRTDKNFAKLLEQSGGADFRSAPLFLTHIMGAPDANAVAEALSYIRRTYGGHPKYLRHNGKPVVFFTDMGRVADSAPVEAWRAIRDRVDPDRGMVWIAEGLDPSYLNVFDGLYVLKITHAAYPDDYLKEPRWARQARAYGADKLWVGTVSPGWDDHIARSQPCDTAGCWLPAPPHVRDREGGGFLAKTFQAAMESQPNWLLVNSWNEFIEGSSIQPSRNFGDLYVGLTGQLMSQFRNGTGGGPSAASPERSEGSVEGPITSPLGFTVTNADGVSFADGFRRFTLESVGHAASRRFVWQGFVTQVMQKLVFQWQPGRGLFYLNVFDELHNAGKDAWLEVEKNIPPPANTSADAGLSWDAVVARHLALLDADPALKAAYLRQPDWLDVYGLPMGYGAYDNVTVVRGQRAALQRWQSATPWAAAGEVTVVNGGDVGKEAGLFPPDALAP